jgi:hypothetical protein
MKNSKPKKLPSLNKVQVAIILMLGANDGEPMKKLTLMSCLYLYFTYVGRKARMSSAVRHFMDIEFPKTIRDPYGRNINPVRQ